MLAWRQSRSHDNQKSGGGFIFQEKCGIIIGKYIIIGHEVNK